MMPSHNNTPSSAAPSQPVVDLDTELAVAKANLATAESDLRRSNEGAISRLHSTSEYQRAAQDLAFWTKQVETYQSLGGPSLASASEKKAAAKAKIAQMDANAPKTDSGVLAANQNLGVATKAVEELKLRIAQRNAKREVDRRAAEQAQLEQLRQNRKAKIQQAFSAWDGSHTKLEERIKASMHNPDSYKHVETRYIDKGDYLVVYTTFRGTNAFGGVITNSVVAKCDLDGNVMEIVKE